MAMQKLPSDIQSLFCASTQIFSYKRAVEELVYNSLDAESTSIAIRVNIEQNTIQVIDNGCGISKCNFSLLGQRYATSKCVDLSTLKSVPNKYGYQGQSLASIIELSQSVKITSRLENSEQTWVKSFYKKKEQKLCQTLQRPSKGTTVDIKGFLYNLKIQKKAIDPLKEINAIKGFLQQMSLVHNNISLSLRDDAKNEIIFKLNKNRDIYQTLTSMFGVDRKDVQELRVEKNQYKLTAFIGKKDTGIIQQHWVYLNGKLLLNSKVQEIINDNLIKYLKLNLQSKRKSKSKNSYNQEEDAISKSAIPFYYIFVNCPYYDYDISCTSKKTIVEFKNWEIVSKLLEKMAKFFAGDLNLKEIKPDKNKTENRYDTENTRDKVKKIMDKILGSNPKKIGISQMQNGIRGKISKRKPKRKLEKLLISNALTKENVNKMVNKVPSMSPNINNEQQPCDVLNNKVIKTSRTEIIKPKTVTTIPHKTKAQVIYNKNKHEYKREKHQPLKNKIREKTKNEIKNIASSKSKFDKNSKEKRKAIPNIVNDRPKNQKLNLKKTNDKVSQRTKKMQQIKQIKQNTETEINRLKLKSDPLLKRFKNPTDSVKERCYKLSKKVDNLIAYKKKRKRKIFVNETVQYSNVIRNNKNYSVRKKVDEIIIHDYFPKPLSPTTIINDRAWNKTRKSFHKSTYDLVQTILRKQNNTNSYVNQSDFECFEPEDNVARITPEISLKNSTMHPSDEHGSVKYIDFDSNINIPHLPVLTYESHNYTENQRIQNDFDKENGQRSPKEKSTFVRFITTQSRDNFGYPTAKYKTTTKIKPKLNQLQFNGRNIQSIINQVDSYNNETPYTIEVSNSSKNFNFIDRDIRVQMRSKPVYVNETLNGNTTSIECNDEIRNNIISNSGLTGFTYTIDNNFMQHSTTNEASNYSQNYKNAHSIKQRTEITIDSQMLQNIGLMDMENEHNVNVVFISKSQEQHNKDKIENETSFDSLIIPINVCETVHSQDEFLGHNSLDKSFDFRREWIDSLFNSDFEIDSLLCDRNIYSQTSLYEPIGAQGMTKENLLNAGVKIDKNIKDRDNVQVVQKNSIRQCTNEANRGSASITANTVNKGMEIEHSNEKSLLKDDSNFNFRNRLRFVPKGMSQIFTKCQSRNVCDYNLEKEYYKDTIYNNFVNNVQQNCAVFEPEVQNVKELTTKTIEKVNNKLNKDNASLVFDNTALKTAQVLKQIDNKFIATKINAKTSHSGEMTQYLVLFDQHAVHERVKLEINLSEYFDGNQWKSLTVDEVTLKLSNDESLFLLNYKEKFYQLGLQWTILNNNEVTINAIPEAILGRNHRQVETVMKAVKNLIIEEIDSIKSQSGCIALYPKSIMELVFSEACRYAIKFGDPLSKAECHELLGSLSDCKTPFQCAHGRPVMAVLVDIKRDPQKYKVNLANVQKWILKKNNKRLK